MCIVLFFPSPEKNRSMTLGSSLMGRATHHQMARPQVVAVCVLGAACAALLLAVAGQSARRSELLGGLLPLKGSHQFDGVPLHHYRHYHPDDNQAWSDMNWRSRTAIAPHGSGHRIFAPLDEPVTHSITRPSLEGRRVRLTATSRCSGTASP